MSPYCSFHVVSSVTLFWPSDGFFHSPRPFLSGGRVEISQFVRIKACGSYCFVEAGTSPYPGIPEGSVYGFGVNRR